MDLYLGMFADTKLYMECEVVGTRIQEGFDGKEEIPLYDVTGFRAERPQVKPVLDERAETRTINPYEIAGTVQATLSFENGQTFTVGLNESTQKSSRQTLALTNIAAPGVVLGWRMTPPRKVIR